MKKLFLILCVGLAIISCEEKTDIAEPANQELIPVVIDLTNKLTDLVSVEKGTDYKSADTPSSDEALTLDDFKNMFHVFDCEVKNEMGITVIDSCCNITDMKNLKLCLKLVEGNYKIHLEFRANRGERAFPHHVSYKDKDVFCGYIVTVDDINVNVSKEETTIDDYSFESRYPYTLIHVKFEEYQDSIDYSLIFSVINLKYDDNNNIIGTEEYSLNSCDKPCSASFGYSYPMYSIYVKNSAGYILGKISNCSFYEDDGYIPALEPEQGKINVITATIKHAWIEARLENFDPVNTESNISITKDIVTEKVVTIE